MGLNIIAIDDEKLALSRLLRTIKEALPDSVVHEFLRVSDVMTEIEKNMGIDIVFSDIEMPNMSGIILAKKIKELSPDTYIIFVTGYEQYAVDAFSLRASGYLLKPVTADSILKQIEFLKTPMKPLQNKKLQIQCFGNFEIFVNGNPVEIKREKSKELLAYLVDRRGAAVSGGELCAVLWEESGGMASKASYLRHIYADLNADLKRINAENILIKGRNSYAVNMNYLDCDFYRFLQQDPVAVNAYRGEYMQQYSWAEMSIANFL